MKLVNYILSGAVVVAIASAVIAAEKNEKPSGTAAEHAAVVDPANLQWGDPPPGLPPGAQVAVLSGDPTKKGIYTLRMRAPAGYKIMPHTHPTAEHTTVLSGIFYMGTGAEFDEAAGHTAMRTGSFMDMPAGTTHFAWSTEESIIQVHAEGPFVIKYVNPVDDPGNAKK